MASGGGGTKHRVQMSLFPVKRSTGKVLDLVPKHNESMDCVKGQNQETKIKTNLNCLKWAGLEPA